jgi:hypothetical protein
VRQTLAPSLAPGFAWNKRRRSSSATSRSRTRAGRAPREAYETGALFQMKFYALVIRRVPSLPGQPASYQG